MAAAPARPRAAPIGTPRNIRPRKAMKSRVAIIAPSPRGCHRRRQGGPGAFDEDRKSTRLNSSHLVISYAVFCLKKKNTESSLLRVRIVFQLVILEKDRASRR